MSSNKKKQVMFYANEGTKAARKKNAIPQTLAPDAVAMAAGQDGAERAQDINDIPVRQPDTVAEQFPTDGLTRQKTEEDVLMEEKLAMVDDEGVTPFGKLIAEDRDFKWLQSMREQEAEADFMQWFATNFDMWGPAQKALAQKLWPDFYAQRESLIGKKLKLMKKIAKIKLNGPKTKKDLQLLYALEAGFIDGEELENLLHPERAAAAKDLQERQANYRRGLLNPRARPRGDWGWNTRETNSKGIATGKMRGEPYKLGVNGGKGFSAYTPGLNESSESEAWEGFSQFQQLLRTARKN